MPSSDFTVSATFCQAALSSLPAIHMDQVMASFDWLPPALLPAEQPVRTRAAAAAAATPPR